MISRYPRVQLASLPTSLEYAPRLAEEIGIDRLLIKRDDNTGLALGGNKARKLEFLMADAKDKGADIVLTCGGPQSNHVRMTVAAANKLGMRTILFMPGSRPDVFQGNMILDEILGADFRFLPNCSYASLIDTMEAEAAKLSGEGHVPYVIPMGGSTPLGALGYAEAVCETATQLKEMGIKDADVIVAVGTSGTLAGITLGTHMFMPSLNVIGISILFRIELALGNAMNIACKAAELVGTAPDALSTPTVYDQYIGEGYGIPTPECVAAIKLAARTEGLILDPVYTGKAMAGLIDLGRKKLIGNDKPVLFWHTGGAPALFAYEGIFSE